jgi:hypothetical protein
MATGIRAGQLFPNPHSGEPWTHHAYNGWQAKVYKPAAAAVGLGADAIPYDLRGSFASLLIWEGRTMLEVATQLCHSVAVCEQHYARVFTAYEPAKRTSAVDAIQAARNGTPRTAARPRNACTER